MELSEKFWSRVDKTETCWIWTAGKSNKYGNFNFNGKNYRVHRLVWESFHGSIPDGMVICHKCDNPPCCNPDHLFMGTQKDNIQDAARKGKYINIARHSSGHKRNSARGENSPHSKLKNNDVKAIREASAQGQGAVEIAKRYSVDPSTIRHILKRYTWKHVD